MATGDIEIELKFPINNPEELAVFLDANATPKQKNVRQVDTYFTPAHRDFLAMKYPYEWLRIREEEKGAVLNYKHFHPENVMKTDYCVEIETPVKNSERFFLALTSKSQLSSIKHGRLGCLVMLRL